MASNPGQNYDSVQKLAASCEMHIGLTRFTKDTISEGPDALFEKAMKCLITPFIETMQIYESLDSSFRMADMSITDPVSWRSIAPLTGHEIISVGYKSGLSGGGPSDYKVINFAIHSINEDPVPTSLSNGFKKLTIKLVEFPIYNFLVSKQTYKTYPIDEKNTPKNSFTDIVNDTLKNIEFFSDWYDIDIEPSLFNNVNFYIPNWYPLKVINYCKKYAVSNSKNYPMYTFHVNNVKGSTKPVAHFKPIYSFVEDQNKYRIYGTSFEDVNKNEQGTGGSYSPTDVIQEHSFQYFDARKTEVLSGNTEVMFDYLQDNNYVASDYDTFLNSTHKAFNPFPVYPFGHGNQWSTIHRAPWNYEEGSKIAKQELQNEYVRNILDGGIRCKAMCSVFEQRTCGERAELIFNVADSDKRYDTMFSGSWITWSVTDHLIAGKSFSTIYFINDGFINITDPSNTFTKINTITGNKAPDLIK